MSIVINQYDSNFRRTGFWSHLSVFQNKVFEGNYIDGNPIGLWKTYTTFENEFCVIEKSQEIRREILYIY